MSPAYLPVCSFPLLLLGQRGHLGCGIDPYFAPGRSGPKLGDALGLDHLHLADGVPGQSGDFRGFLSVRMANAFPEF